MPAGIGTFDMLRKSSLEGMSDAMLANELVRIQKMHDAVQDYLRLVMEIVRERVAG